MAVKIELFPHFLQSNDLSFIFPENFREISVEMEISADFGSERWKSCKITEMSALVCSYTCIYIVVYRKISSGPGRISALIGVLVMQRTHTRAAAAALPSNHEAS